VTPDWHGLTLWPSAAMRLFTSTMLELRALRLYEWVRPQSHDKSSTEQSCTCPSMMRRPRSQQPAMAPISVGYVMGALKARKPLRRPIRRSRVQRPEPRI
jgi:hypothetical protein